MIDLPLDLPLDGLSTIEGISFSDIEAAEDAEASVSSIYTTRSNPVSSNNMLWIAAQTTVSVNENYAYQSGPATLFGYDLSTGELLNQIPIEMPVQANDFFIYTRRTLEGIEGTDYVVALGITDQFVEEDDPEHWSDDYVNGTSVIKIIDTATGDVVNTQEFGFVDENSTDEHDGVRLSEDGRRLSVDGDFYEFDGASYTSIDLPYEEAQVEDYLYTWEEEASPTEHDYTAVQTFPNFYPEVSLDDTILRDVALINDQETGLEVYVGHHRDYHIVDRQQQTAYRFELPVDVECYRFFTMNNPFDPTEHWYQSSCLLESAGATYYGMYAHFSTFVSGRSIFMGYGSDVYRVDLPG